MATSNDWEAPDDSEAMRLKAHNERVAIHELTKVAIQVMDAVAYTTPFVEDDVLVAHAFALASLIEREKQARLDQCAADNAPY